MIHKQPYLQRSNQDKRPFGRKKLISFLQMIKMVVPHARNLYVVFFVILVEEIYDDYRKFAKQKKTFLK